MLESSLEFLCVSVQCLVQKSLLLSWDILIVLDRKKITWEQKIYIESYIWVINIFLKISVWTIWYPVIKDIEARRIDI